MQTGNKNQNVHVIGGLDGYRISNIRGINFEKKTTQDNGIKDLKKPTPPFVPSATQLL